MNIFNINYLVLLYIWAQPIAATTIHSYKKKKNNLIMIISGMNLMIPLLPPSTKKKYPQKVTEVRNHPLTNKEDSFNNSKINQETPIYYSMSEYKNSMTYKIHKMRSINLSNHL